jgi:branched-subunit amino acid ABC-type transport system permease component
MDADPETAAERTATASGFTGSVLGAVGGPVGATVGGLVWGTAGYVAGYTAAKAREEFEGSSGSKTVSVEIDVEEAGNESEEDDDSTQ